MEMEAEQNFYFCLMDMDLMNLSMGAMNLLDVGIVLDPGMPCREWGGLDTPRENPHFWNEWPGHAGGGARIRL